MVERDNSMFCCYCGRRFSFSAKLTSDHLIPRSKGGVNNAHNKRNCCSNCNASKRSYYPEQWLMLLEKERRRLKKRGFGLYEIDLQIENVKYIVEYVQLRGERLFVNSGFYENYLDRRGVVLESID
jgi:hypothetical protein